MRDYYLMYSGKLFFNYYFYVDVDKNFSRKIFRDNGVKVFTINKSYYRDSEYVLVYCRTFKKYDEFFNDCMEKLRDKMLLMGRTDYLDFTRSLMKEIIGKDNYIIDCSGLLSKSYIVQVIADSYNHKEFVVVPDDKIDSLDEKEVSDKIKNLIDKYELPYRKLIIKVRNMENNSTKIFSFINEDENVL